MPILNAAPRIIRVVFFRSFSITGLQEKWFASDVIFCITDTDHNSQSTFIPLKIVVMIMQPTCWLLVHNFASYVKCSVNSLQASYFAKFSDIISDTALVSEGNHLVTALSFIFTFNHSVFLNYCSHVTLLMCGPHSSPQLLIWFLKNHSFNLKWKHYLDAKDYQFLKKMFQV